MDKSFGLKNVLFYVIAIFSTSSVAAQTGLNPGSWGILQGGAGGQLTSVLDTVFWYDITTIPQAVMFIAVLAAVYFIELKLVHIIFQTIHQRIESGSKLSLNKNEEPSRAEQGISLAIAFITTQYLGTIGIVALAVTGLLGVLMFAATTGGIFSYFRRGGSEISLGDSSGSDSGSFIDVTLGGQAGNDADEAENVTEDGEQAEERAEEEAERAEEREQAGDEEAADELARDAADQLEQALQEFEIAAEDINELLELDIEQLHTTLEELHTTLEEVGEEEELIQRVGKYPGRVSGRIQSIRQSVQDGQASEFDDISERDLMWLGYGDQGPTLVELFDESQELNEVLETLEKEMMQEHHEEEEEGKELATEVKELLTAHQIIQRLKNDVGMAQHIDEDELEVLAQQIGDKKLHEEIGYEENQEEQLIDELQQLMGKEEKIESYLKKAEEILSKIIEMDREEIDQIRAEEGSLGDLKTEFRQLENLIEGTIGKTDLSVQLPEGGQIVIGEFLKDFGRSVAALERKVDDALDMKQNNEAEVEEILNYVESSVNQLEQ